MATNTFEVDGITYEEPFRLSDRQWGPIFWLKDDASRCRQSCECSIGLQNEPRRAWTEYEIDRWVKTGQYPWQ